MRRTPAKVTWIGERPHESGIWYHVDFDSPNMQWPPNHSDRLNHYQFENQYNSGMSGSSSVAPANSRHYFSANQLHMPMKGGTIPTTLYDNRKPVTTFNGVNKDDEYRTAPKPAPRERIIPITQQVDTERPSRSIRPTDSGYNSFSVNSAQPPHASTSSLSPAPAQPSRSKSANNIKKRNQVAEYNEPVENEQLVFRIGDPCVWNNNGKEEKGIVRYIGFLKGHKMLYAGVEFNNRIGAGTGVFNKEQLFESRDGHAGFVELASLESPSTLHKRRLSSSRSQQMPAAAGTSNGARHYSNGKQASNESLSDPPPPPYAPPSPPRGTGHNHQLPPPIPPKPTAHVEDFLIEKFELGSLVVVEHLGAERTGVVRWLGEEMDEQGGRLVRSAIVELDGEVPPAWRRGNEAVSFTGTTNFPSALVPVHALRRNRSASGPDGIVFPAATSSGTLGRRTEEFGTIDSGIEKQKCAPAKDAMQLVGRMKGIQGHCNSCYIDATLYAMFAQTSFFDFLLEKTIKGSEKASQFQKILAQEIVFPLRKFHYVRADHVMKLRKLLAELMPHVSGLTSEEKDPEEILAFIFAEIFNADPFIKLLGPNNSKDSQYLVPIVVDDWQGGAATSQHLLERHMRSAQVTFAKPPPVLIMQLPRYGQQKVFDKILPLETIDITPFVAGATPACAKCGACSDLYCPTCFLTRRVFFTEIVFCHNCFRHSHYLPEIQDHEPRLLHAPGKSPKKPNSCKMVLSAVLCIETSHYVAYVKTSANQWLFFDSMADREGLSDGFNVPVVQECGNMSDWLSLQGWNRLKDADETGQIKAMFGKAVLDPLVGRLLSDSYICFYEEMSTSSPSATSQFFSTLKNRMN
uniref:ubiquitinyl hydrolase 1 n=1 Tax=Caenorhabditis japonica TaxID=281687 RepID=A0A8R1HIW6_CAEJA